MLLSLKPTIKAGLNQKGMTLVETMIVLAILGSLATILITRVSAQYDKAQIRQAKIQIGEIKKNLEFFNADCGFYPTTEQGLEALIEAPTNPSCDDWGPSPYIDKIPEDPWKSKYIYESDGGGSYVIITLGKDRREGGKGVNADISSDDL